MRYGERNSNGFSRADVFTVEGNRYGRKLVSLLPVGKQIRRKRPGQISVHCAVVHLVGNHGFQKIVFDRYVRLRHVQSARYRAVGGSNGVICRFQFIIENNIVTSRRRGRRRAVAGKPYGYYVCGRISAHKTFKSIPEKGQIVLSTRRFADDGRSKLNRKRSGIDNKGIQIRIVNIYGIVRVIQHNRINLYAVGVRAHVARRRGVNSCQIHRGNFNFILIPFGNARGI